MTLRSILTGLFVVMAAPATLAEDLRLVMFEQPGCVYCARWNEEIAPEYPKTVEGKAAPLLRLQLRDPLPEGVTLMSKPVFTPTFVLLSDGTEAGRIEGYPGEDFFLPLLAEMIKASEG